jgi:hypothetical protein
MKYLNLASLSAAVLIGFVEASAAANRCDAIADPAQNLTCMRDLMSDVDQAIAWLKSKQDSDPAGTQAALSTCQRTVPAGSDISVLLNCMLDIVGP